MVKKKVTMTIDAEIFRNFKEYCNSNGMKVSTRVELLMKHKGLRDNSELTDNKIG